MAVLTEFAVMVICELTGFKLKKLLKGESSDRERVEMRGHISVHSTLSSSAGLQLIGGRRKRIERKRIERPRRKFKGPVSWLYF